MTTTRTIVCVIDDDPSVRRGLERLLRSAGFAARGFASAEAFLEEGCPDASCCCLVVDVRMPGMGGLGLQSHLATAGNRTPVIFITAHDDDQVAAEAMRGGAKAFFHKPVDDQALIEAITSSVHSASSDEEE